MRAVVIGALVTAIGCFPDEGIQDGGTDDSPMPDVSRAETRGEEARQLNDWTVHPLPDLHLGAVDDQLPYQFAEIRGMRVMSDGRLVVIDGSSREVRFYSSSGVFLHGVGGRGAGPGEFESIDLVNSPAQGDSLFLYDRGQRRMTVLSPDGNVARIFSVNASGSARAVGIVRSSVLMRTDIESHTPGMWTTRVIYTLVGDEGETGDTIMTTGGLQQYVTLDLNEGTPTTLTVPFSVDRAQSVDLTGESFYVTSSENNTITQYGGDGRAIRTLRLVEPAKPIADSDLERFYGSRLARLQGHPSIAAAVRSVYLQMPRLGAVPAFQDIHVDELGYLWAELYRPYDETSAERWMRFSLWSQLQYTPPVPTPALWIVFDRNGHARGTVEMPAGLEVLQIGPDYVLGRWQNDHGIEFVRRHRLVGGTTTP